MKTVARLCFGLVRAKAPQTLWIVLAFANLALSSGYAWAESRLQYKQLAGPPSEMRTIAPPDPASTATDSKSAVLQIQFAKTSHGLWIWQTEIPVEATTLRFAALAVGSDSVVPRWRTFIRNARVHPVTAMADVDSRESLRPESVSTTQAELYEVTNLTPGTLLPISLESDVPAEGFLVIEGSGAIWLRSHQVSFNQRVGQRIGLVARTTEQSDETRAAATGRVTSAVLKVTTPDGSTFTASMQDDGLHQDQRAGDGIYGADFLPERAGLFRAQIVFTGRDRAGQAYVRTAEHLIPILPNALSLRNHPATATVSGPRRLAVRLEVVPSQAAADHYRVFAEVWGTDPSDGTPVPIAWIGGMTQLDSNDLNLGLDTRWIAMAKARAPFELRNLRIEDPDFFITMASAERQPLTMPDLSGFDLRAEDIVIDEEMRMGPRPAVISGQPATLTDGDAPRIATSAAPEAYDDGTGHILLLVHGYCSGNVWGQVQSQFTNSGVFLDLDQNRSIDAFALAIKNAALAWNSYAIVAHSQGGMAALHLYANYWSGLDNAGPGRLIQSVGTPYLGTPLMSVNGFFGGVFGCGYQANLTPSGASTWLSGIPTEYRAKVNYYTTSFTDYAFQDDWCNSITDVLLNAPDDGVVEQTRGQLSGGVNRGHTIGQCHSTGLGFNREGPQYLDSSRNAVMNSNAAVGPPVVITTSASNIGQSSATLNGTVNPSGASTTTAFEYGLTTSYGSTIAAQTRSGFTTQNISATPSLSCGKTYQYRAKGTNSAATRYGANQFVTTQPCTYTISLSASPAAGGTVSGGGTFAGGTSRTVTASPNSGYAFSSWTENGTIVSASASYTFTLNANRTLVASFTAQSYTISVSASPAAGGTVSGGGTFSAGSSRTVTASANSGYTFTNWTENGNVISSSASYTFTLNSNRTLVANFSATSNNYTISVSASPQAGGTVSGGGTFPSGSSRTVSASANSGYTFTNWTENGNVVSTSTSYTFTLNGNRTLVANFSATPNNYTISVSASPQAGGTVSGGGTFPAGSSRTVTASANSSYTFTNWTESGNVVSTSTSYTFTLNGNRTLVANFSGASSGSPHPFIEVTDATVQVHDLGVGSDGSVYVLFGRSDPKELVVVKSTNGGESWQSPVVIPSSDHSNSDFDLAIDAAGTIHVVWWLGSTDQVYYSRSTNGGASFSAPIGVRSGNSYSGYSTRNAVDPVVAADGSGNVYVAFGAYTMNSAGDFLGYNVWVSKSTNGGSSFQSEIPINAISSSQKKPRSIRAVGSNFYLLYLDETNDDLYFHRSTAGALATNPQVNSHAGSVMYSGDLAVGPGESSFYAVYSDTFNDSEGNITLCKSTDGGNSWPTCKRVNDNTYRWQEGPAIGIDSAGRLHVTWSDLRGDEYQTYYAYSTDGGEVFSTNVDVSEPFTTFRFTQAHLVVDDGHASLYLSATRETSQVMVARRSTNVQPPTDLTAPTGSISVNSGATHTNSTSVTLTLNATDAVGVVGYYTSNSSVNPSAGQVGWVSVGSTTSFNDVVNGWTIAGEGSRTVYVWFKDAAGNVSARRSDAIILDQTPPTNPTLTATAGPANVQLSWTGETDALSGVASAKLVFTVGATPPANCSGTALATGSPYTHTGLTPSQPYSYRICITDYAGNTSSGATATATPLPGVRRVRNDINNDDRADLLWRNNAAGQASIWFMNGTAYTGTVIGTFVPSVWTPAVTGDFDGDDTSDVFWHNGSTGATSVWLGWNGSTFATQVAGPTIPVAWVPVAAGDINGDGKDDIFWHNATTGETSIWFMNGSTYSSAVRSTTVPTTWVPVFIGNFDSDLKADVFWRNPATGETSLWMGWNGSGFAVQIRSVTAPTVWIPAGTGDITGDGRSDIVWRNSATGQTSMWVMNGGNSPQFVMLTTVVTSWTPVAFGDYDGDSHADVFWYNSSTGETSFWVGWNGTEFTTMVRSTTVPMAWVPFVSR